MMNDKKNDGSSRFGVDVEDRDGAIKKIAATHLGPIFGGLSRQVCGKKNSDLFKLSVNETYNRHGILCASFDVEIGGRLSLLKHMASSILEGWGSSIDHLMGPLTVPRLCRIVEIHDYLQDHPDPKGWLSSRFLFGSSGLSCLGGILHPGHTCDDVRDAAFKDWLERHT